MTTTIDDCTTILTSWNNDDSVCKGIVSVFHIFSSGLSFRDIFPVDKGFDDCFAKSDVGET